MESSVALPSPAIAAKPRLHPPYKEMILTAVVSLNERGGSSKRAISKFIKTTYIHLPMKHDALLACHLRRLRTEGTLHMLRHSYKLSPRSKLNLAPSVATSRPRGRPKKVPETSQLSVGLSGKLAVKRAPGRPPKSLAVKRGPGRPPKSQLLVLKKGPGRPPKILAVGTAMVALGGARKRGRPPNSEKKGPGRPRKEPGVQLQRGKKRKGPGRPRKVESKAPTVRGEEKKGPGRPKMVKNAPAETAEKKEPGKPRKEGNDVASEQVSGKKRGRGRPKKDPSLTDVVVN